MTDERYNFVPREYWPRLGPAFQGIDRDLEAIHDDLAGLAAGGGGGGVAVTWSTLSGKPTLAAVATSGAYADLTGKPAIPDVTTLAPKASPTFTGTVTGVTKAMVGLGSVDNTADNAKAFAGSQITSGTIPAARLGTGTASATTYLAGDGTWKALTKSTVGLANVDNTADAVKTFTAAQTTSGVFAVARLGTGTASSTTVLHGDGTWKTPAASGSFPAGGDVTITQNANGSWPTITRVANVHYRWLCAYDATKWPTTTNGAAAGDELVGADASVVP